MHAPSLARGTHAAPADAGKHPNASIAAVLRAAGRGWVEHRWVGHRRVGHVGQATALHTGLAHNTATRQPCMRGFVLTHVCGGGRDGGIHQRALAGRAAGRRGVGQSGWGVWAAGGAGCREGQPGGGECRLPRCGTARLAGSTTPPKPAAAHHGAGRALGDQRDQQLRAKAGEEGDAGAAQPGHEVHGQQDGQVFLAGIGGADYQRACRVSSTGRLPGWVRHAGAYARHAAFWVVVGGAGWASSTSWTPCSCMGVLLPGR